MLCWEMPKDGLCLWGARERGWGVWSWVRSFPLGIPGESPAQPCGGEAASPALPCSSGMLLAFLVLPPSRLSAGSIQVLWGLPCAVAAAPQGGMGSAGCSQARGAVLPPPPPPPLCAHPRGLHLLNAPDTSVPVTAVTAGHWRGELIPPDHPKIHTPPGALPSGFSRSGRS